MFRFRPIHFAVALSVLFGPVDSARAAAPSPAVDPAASPDRAARVSPDAKASAQRLFDAAKALHEEGRFADACSKFEESLRLDFGIGTLLFLSDCHEQIGKTASAWAGFLEAASYAKSRGQAERERIARSRASALEGRLSMLRVDVSPAARAIGVVVRRNGVVVGTATYGEPIPVDPGAQTIVAEAPEHRAWTTTLQAPSGPATTPVLVPELAPTNDADASVRAGSWLTPPRVAGVVLGGVGVVGLGVGTAFGAIAVGTWSEAQATCSSGTTGCTAEGVRLGTRAEDHALASTIGVAAGSALVVSGALLVLLTGDEGSVKLGAWIEPQSSGIALRGAL
jgi:serine/threonine-protein kinase